MPGPQLGRGVRITQGPEWLVDFYLTPPAWVNPTIRVLGALALVLVTWRLYQRGWTIDAKTQLQMGKIAGTVVGVVSGVLAMANLTNEPYAVDVTVGFAVGYGTMLIASSSLALSWARSTIQDDEIRRAVAWVGVAVVAVFVPMLVNVHGHGLSLFNGRLAVTLVALCMAGLNLHEFESDFEKDSNRIDS